VIEREVPAWLASSWSVPAALPASAQIGDFDVNHQRIPPRQHALPLGGHGQAG
jgi:hypothetical protein